MELAIQFIDWRSRQKTTIIGGILMYDVHGYYKYISEKELFDFYLNRIIGIGV